MSLSSEYAITCITSHNFFLKGSSNRFVEFLFEGIQILYERECTLSEISNFTYLTPQTMTFSWTALTVAAV